MTADGERALGAHAPDRSRAAVHASTLLQSRGRRLFRARRARSGFAIVQVQLSAPHTLHVCASSCGRMRPAGGSITTLDTPNWSMAPTDVVRDVAERSLERSPLHRGRLGDDALTSDDRTGDVPIT